MVRRKRKAIVRFISFAYCSFLNIFYEDQSQIEPQLSLISKGLEPQLSLNCITYGLTDWQTEENLSTASATFAELFQCYPWILSPLIYQCSWNNIFLRFKHKHYWPTIRNARMDLKRTVFFGKWTMKRPSKLWHVSKEIPNVRSERGVTCRWRCREVYSEKNML